MTYSMEKETIFNLINQSMQESARQVRSSLGHSSYEISREKSLAEKLIRRPKSQNTATHLSWRDIVISERVKSMTLGPSELSKDTRSDKELLAEALEEKYR